MEPPPDVLAVAEDLDELAPGTAEVVAALNADLAGLGAEAIRAELIARVWRHDHLRFFLRCGPRSAWHLAELRTALATGNH